MTASPAARSHATAVMREVAKQRGIDALAPHIQRSRDRCLRQYGIHPAARRDTPVLPAGRLPERPRRLGALLEIARPEMENLRAAIVGSGCAVTISDAECTRTSIPYSMAAAAAAAGHRRGNHRVGNRALRPRRERGRRG